MINSDTVNMEEKNTIKEKRHVQTHSLMWELWCQDISHQNNQEVNQKGG